MSLILIRYFFSFLSALKTHSNTNLGLKGFNMYRYIQVKFISTFLIFSYLIPYVYSTVQCNLGLKLYSVESGKVVCAPFGHYGCTESCEWNTTCTKTSHFIAFKGRRTYVSGFILTDNNFLVQCCGSLGTIVQMNRLNEPLCVWTSWVNSVELMGSIRMDPPLSKNEYIRDIMMERIPKTGRVKLRLQICKFLTQRTNCDKDKMISEERHHYSLLLLRLYRIQTLLNSTATLSKSAKEIVENNSKPSSAAFSVVSRIDENREIGSGIVSGIAGSGSTHEFTGIKISGLQPFHHKETFPHINTNYWDNQSGIPKHSLNNSPPPPGLLPPSSFNFDITSVNNEFEQKIPQKIQQQKVQIIKRPYGQSKRLSTNATREYVTRYIKARDDFSLDKQALLEESPIKNGLIFKKIKNNQQQSQMMIQSIKTTTNSSTINYFQSTTIKPFAISLPPNYWKTVSVNNNEFFLPKQIRPDPLQGLLSCCQNQAPGCQQLCKKDVTKDEIRRAIVSQQCPPLSMTSVISCFPQYYDTTSVSQCCSISTTLPKQCLALCQPNFKPTLAHLACIDHISTIVDCYRDLMK